MSAAMAQGVVTAAYIAAAVLFILSLGGLSTPETSRRGNVYGMAGMTIAVGATILGLVFATVSRGGHLSSFGWLAAALLAGTVVGALLAARVKMTQMPELVALMHSLVGLAAMLVGYANFIDPSVSVGMTPAEKSIHEIEMYLGVLIGAVTFSGSVIAFGKLQAKLPAKVEAAFGPLRPLVKATMSSRPILLPGRHAINGTIGAVILLLLLGPRAQGAELKLASLAAGGCIRWPTGTACQSDPANLTSADFGTFQSTTNGGVLDSATVAPGSAAPEAPSAAQKRRARARIRR